MYYHLVQDESFQALNLLSNVHVVGPATEESLVRAEWRHASSVAPRLFAPPSPPPPPPCMCGTVVAMLLGEWRSAEPPGQLSSFTPRAQPRPVTLAAIGTLVRFGGGYAGRAHAGALVRATTYADPLVRVAALRAIALLGLAEVRVSRGCARARLLHARLSHVLRRAVSSCGRALYSLLGLMRRHLGADGRHARRRLPRARRGARCGARAR